MANKLPLNSSSYSIEDDASASSVHQNNIGNADVKKPDEDEGFSPFMLMAMVENAARQNAGSDFLPDSLGFYIPEDLEVNDNASVTINGQTITANNFYSGASRSGDFSSFSGVFSGGGYDVSGFIPKLGRLSNIHADGSFQQSFAIVMDAEGGFSNNKSDRGGATIFGIASRSNPGEYQQIMSLLKSGDKQGALNATMQVYKAKYWDTAGIGNLRDPEARLVAFDAAINHGAGYARKMIGKVGEDADAMLRYRSNTYIQIAASDPSQQVFMNGWRNRLAKLDSIVSNDAAPFVQMASSTYHAKAGSPLATAFHSADAIKLPDHHAKATAHPEQASWLSRAASTAAQYIPNFWS